MQLSNAHAWQWAKPSVHHRRPIVLCRSSEQKSAFPGPSTRYSTRISLRRCAEIWGKFSKRSGGGKTKNSALHPGQQISQSAHYSGSNIQGSPSFPSAAHLQWTTANDSDRNTGQAQKYCQKGSLPSCTIPSSSGTQHALIVDNSETLERKWVHRIMCTTQSARPSVSTVAPAINSSSNHSIGVLVRLTIMYRRLVTHN